jgi:serine/threonine-protein kinase
VTLAAGARLGPYEIVSALGAGGMGEVYRARDAKLNRDVALKVLPEAFMLDPDRLARFKREAQVLASLNHPNIAAIYGFEDSNPSPGSSQSAVQALVLELVEGPTLADRIAQGAISLDEALPNARQIAEALEAAHEQGIIHRDLKPANIKLRPDGAVKVLDFGLAKALEPVSVKGGDVTASPTITSPAMTQMGIILGTAAYMSPEQAKGRQADKRSDVWAFGCVLYEMLSGQRAFKGDDIPDTLAAVLRQDIDWTALPDSTPASVRRLMARCLDRDARRRLRDIGEARIVLEDPAAPARGDAGGVPAVAMRQPLWRRAIPVVLSALVASLITGAVIWTLRPLASPPVVIRFPVTLPEGQQLTSASRNGVAISPDGTQIAYVTAGQLYVRSMSELEGKPITGKDQGNVANPVFSPDSRSIAFYTPIGRALQRVGVGGGAAVTITPTDGAPLGMSWDNDAIVFVGDRVKGIYRVAANGGKPDLIAAVKDGELAYGPQMLPDRQHVLFTIASGPTSAQWDRAQIVVESVTTHERKIVLEGGSDARYLPTGHIVYALGGVLFAVPFDVRRLEVSGGPTPIVEGIRRAVTGATGVAFFDVSGNGSLIYAPGPESGSASALDVAVIDIASGNSTALKLPPALYEFPRVSPDGKRIAVHADDGRDVNIWIHELSGAISARRLTNGGHNRFPVWSPDGQRVAFQSDREGDLGIFSQRADGSGAASRLTKPDKDTAHVPESWSRDGTLMFAVTKGLSNTLWTLAPQDNKPAPFDGVRSMFLPAAAFSPDGRWVAYTVGRSLNEIDVFVQPFPSTGSTYLITGSGIHPFWSPDGKELFYRFRGQTFAVSITTRPTFAVGNPRSVNGPYRVRGPQFERENDITPDGKQFVGVVARGATPSPITSASQLQVVLNWFEELKARVPSTR